jgi:hypothetical protein
MAFLGGLFGGSKSNTAQTLSQGTNVSSEVGVNVSADISPEFSFDADNSFAPTFNPTNVNAIDLTGFSEAMGAVAGVLQTVAGNVAASEARNQKQAQTTSETSNNLLDGIQKFGGAATALLAIMAVIFALRDPGNVRVQL